MLQADAGSEHERILFGLPVVLDTDDDSVAVGDTILLQYQVGGQGRPRRNAVCTAGRRAVAARISAGSR